MGIVQRGASQKIVEDEVKWHSFISSHDLVFDTMSEKWEEASYFARAEETKNPNVDQALIRWDLSALIKASKVLSIDTDERLRWQEVLSHLAA